METNIPMEEAPQSNKKMIMIVGILVGLIILVLLGIVLVNSKKKNPSKEPSKQTGAITAPGINDNPSHRTISPVKLSLSSSDISSSILSWLTTQKNSDGIYNYSYKCLSKDDCKGVSFSYQAGIQVMWGRYQHYLKTKDAKDLATINEDAKTFNSDKVKVIQNDFLNCTLLKDLYESENFTTEQRENIKNVCLFSDDLPIGELDVTKPVQVADINKFKQNENPDSSLSP
ncbi:MAG: hypothetical protein ABIO02_01560, partial [Patescibacteria group bacterium]